MPWIMEYEPPLHSHGKPKTIPVGIVFGFPCECKGGSFKIIQGIAIDDYSRDKMNKTLKELTDERDAVKDML